MTVAQSVEALARVAGISDLAHSIYQWMRPYADTLADCRQGVLDALENRPAPGGFVICATDSEDFVGVLVMLRTGMSGYIPPNLLLFLAVKPSRRRRGIATLLVQRALEITSGSVKLHVEADNPARFLYEKIGFNPAYLDMRYIRKGGSHE